MCTFWKKSVVAAQMPQKSLKSVHCRKNFLKIFREKCTLDLKSALTTLFTPILDPDVKNGGTFVADFIEDRPNL